MRKFCLSALACAIALLPVAEAHPQNGLQLQTAAFSELPRVKAVDLTEVVAIGAGVVIGGAAGYWLIPFNTGTVIGAVTGGLVGGWWYEREVDDYAPLPSRNAQ